MISIITPNFNRAYIIDETAKSILGQSHDQWEWIIVDDGSTDESWSKLKAYAAQDSRIRVFQRSREPKGACTCRNIGVEHANGNHLLFLDSDDLLGRDSIANRVRWIEQPQNSGIPIFPIVTFEQTPKAGFLWDDKHHPVSWLTGLFTMTPSCQGTAPLWQKKDFLQVGGWREDLNVWQDVELHIRAYLKGIRFNHVPSARPDVFLRMSPDSISHVNFHSPEKAKSRCTVVLATLDEIDKVVLTHTELLAFQTMIFGVTRNLLNTSQFSESKKLIRSAREKKRLTHNQFRFLQFLQAFTRIRLYRVPILRKLMIGIAQRLFRYKSPRRLNSIPYAAA